MNRIKNTILLQADKVRREGTVPASSIMLITILAKQVTKKMKQIKNPCPQDIPYVSRGFAS